ncbi:hypothetical protein CAEBREN_10205 [Caenorhabditis brenneri]|uniref:Uncharacterized protein n=1 Tax=Caenorhabditis brenneri TaxID=135651 RepID=G0NGM3_CAEBE|nr:hypothetical protein CAEBREN_10205 [Caenorhabditis brenneri]
MDHSTGQCIENVVTLSSDQKLPEQNQSLLGIAVNFLERDGNNDSSHHSVKDAPPAPSTGEVLGNEGVTTLDSFSALPSVARKDSNMELIQMMPKSLEDLPQLPLGEIMKKVDMVETIDLALSSLHVRDTAISLRLSAASIKWIILAPGHFVIHLLPMDPNQNRIIFKLAQESSAIFHPACVNHHKVQIARSRSVFTLKCGSDVEENFNLLNDLTKTILEFVAVKGFNFQSNIYVDFPFAITKSFGSFLLSGGSLTSVQMRTLMEEISVDIFKLENVFYADSGDEVFQLKHREMRFPLPSWMCLQALIDSKCEKLHITPLLKPSSKSSPKPKGFMDAVKGWMTSMMAQFKFFTSTDESPMVEFRKKIISGLRNRSVDEQLDGWIIECSDGRKAVVNVLLSYLVLNLID